MDMDDRFANGAYIADGASYPAKWQVLAAEFREGAVADLDVSYGPSSRQVMDVFYPEGPSKGVVMFVHGGYWLAFDKSVWSHLAAGPLAHGWTVVIPSYDLCPDVHVSEITKQIESAARYCVAHFDGDLRFTGHSAGGHLVARLAGMDWGGRLKRVLPISPVADLMPLLQTSMNADLQLDAAEAFAESPVNMAMPDVPITIWVGGAERPVFQEQAAELANVWKCGLVVTENQHHFNVIDPLADPDSTIVMTLLS